jgi:HK97 family phage major capsid protein
MGETLKEKVKLAEDLCIDKDEFMTLVKNAMQEVGDPNLIKEEVNKYLDVERNKLFPERKMWAEGGRPSLFYRSETGSEINMSDPQQPWRHLSKEMEHFVMYYMAKGDLNLLSNAGVPIDERWQAPSNRLPAEQFVQKATGLSEGVAADGGYLVPTEFMATVIEFAIKQSPLLQKVWRIPMGSNVKKIPKLVQSAGSYFGGLALYWIDEAATKTGTKPAFDQITLTARKLIGLTYLTDELIDDSMINIVNFLTKLFVDAMRYELENKILNGTGTGQPLGVIADTNVNLVPRATASQLVYADVVAMDTIIDENIMNLTWTMRKASKNQLRLQVDSQNRPFWLDGYAGGQNALISPAPDRLIGYDVALTRNSPALYSKGDLVLGDWGLYLLGYRQDVRVAVSIHDKWTTDETSYRFVMRVDGTPGQSKAFAVLKAVTS